MATNSKTLSTKYKGIYRCALSGLSHSSYALYAKQIEAGDELELRRDAHNQYDQFAIKVCFDGEQIGWIPKGQNEILARLLDHGLDVRAKVISHDTGAALDKRLYILVCLAVVE